MENPYDLSWLLVGIAAGVLAGSLKYTVALRPLVQLLVLAFGTFLCWRITLLSVEWAYSHPFNPDDGAAKAFAYLFGWIFSLVFVILPSFAVTSLARILYKRRKSRSGAT